MLALFGNRTVLAEFLVTTAEPTRSPKDGEGKVKPFGGKTMLFMGVAAQLRPVCGEAIYDQSVDKPVSKSGRKTYYKSKQMSRTLRGQELYVKYLSPLPRGLGLTQFRGTLVIRICL